MLSLGLTTRLISKHVNKALNFCLIITIPIHISRSQLHSITFNEKWQEVFPQRLQCTVMESGRFICRHRGYRWGLSNVLLNTNGCPWAEAQITLRQSVIPSWRRAPTVIHDHILVHLYIHDLCSLGGISLKWKRVFITENARVYTFRVYTAISGIMFLTKRQKILYPFKTLNSKLRFGKFLHFPLRIQWKPQIFSAGKAQNISLGLKISGV